MHYWEDLGTDMYQRLKICQQLARTIASEKNEELIENSTKYFNSKIKPITFEVDKRVLVKIHNFLCKKMAETFKGPFQVKKVHENSMYLDGWASSKKHVPGWD